MPSTTTTTAAAAPQNERQTEAALENEQRTEQQDGSDSDWDMDPTAPDTRAWVSKNNKKKEIIVTSHHFAPFVSSVSGCRASPSGQDMPSTPPPNYYPCFLFLHPSHVPFSTAISLPRERTVSDEHVLQPPSTYSNGNMVKIVVHGVARTTGTITRKAWSSNRREWDYEVQTLDGGKSWKVEDELEPVMERRR